MKSLSKIKSNKRRGDGKIVRKVAIYIRVSTDEQKYFGDSLRMQRELLENWAKENDYLIYNVYIDDGYSGTTLKRPALQEMLSQSEEFDLVIFYRLDRFVRGVKLYYKIMETLDSTDTNWRSITENYDSSTANGRLNINVMLSVSENEAAITAERIKAVFKSKLENGEIIGGSISLGYKKVIVEGKKTLQVDEEKAEFVKHIFEQYDKYGSLSKTSKMLNSSEWKCDTKKLKAILKNKLYLGIYSAPSIGDFPDFCTPIIEKDLFYRVQKKLEKNAKTYVSQPNKTYIFSGLMKCATCGTRLSGNTKRRPSKSGVRIEKTYRCQYHQRKDCTNKRNAYEPTVEKHLLSNVRKELNNKILEFDAKEIKPPVDTTQKQINKLTNKLTKLKDLYMDDLILKEEYERDFNAIKKELDVLTQHQVKPKEFKKKDFLKFLSHDFETTYHTLTDLEKRRLWLSVVETIKLDEDGNFLIEFV